MTNEEYLKCIKHLNPEAHCVVWQDNEKQWVVWDNNHKGGKPTIKECEAVLSIVQTQIQQEQDDIVKEKKIKDEIDRTAREQAITNLRARGEI